MKMEDYSKYYIQGSDHYLIPKDIFDELFNEMSNWREESKELNQKYLNAVVDYEITMSDKTELEKQLEYLRSGEYLNQLRFERDMLQDLVDKKEISKEDKEFIDMTHRNTELLEENQELKRKLNEAIHEATEFESEVYELEKQVENYKKLGFKHLQDKNNNLEAQQKKFIEYMNKTMEECNNYSKYIEKKTKELHGRSYGKTYIANEIMKNEVAKKILKETLSKYREIIGE